MNQINNPEDFPKLSLRLEQDGKFYIDYYNGTAPIEGKFSVVDYYTDNLIYITNLNIHNGTIWIRPNDIVFRDYLFNNGYYLEIRDEMDRVLIYRTIRVKDGSKHPLSRVYNKLRLESLDMENEIKFLEFVHFKDMYFYNELKIPTSEIKTFIDAGANFGMFALALYELGAKKGYLVEADPRLTKIMENSIVLDGIEIVGKALYDKNSFLEFNTFSGSVNGKLKTDENDSNFSQNDKETFLGTVKVPTVEINTFLDETVKEKEIDLFKIDIEGAEYAVFDKMTKENLNRSKRYLIEFHDNTDGRVFKLVNLLTNNGYSMQFAKFDPSEPDDILNNKMGVIYAFKI